MNKDLLLALGERLKEARTRNKLTQKQFVEGLSIGAATLSAYENGVSSPSVTALAEIAEKNNLSLDWLVGLGDEKLNTRKVKTYADFARLLYEIGSIKEISISNDRRGEVELVASDSIILKLFSDFCKMYSLQAEGTISGEIYKQWLKAKFKELEMPIGEDIGGIENVD